MKNGRNWFYKRNKNLTYHYIAARVLCYLGLHLGFKMDDEDRNSTYEYINCDYCHTRKELWRYPKCKLTVKNVEWEKCR